MVSNGTVLPPAYYKSLARASFTLGVVLLPIGVLGITGSLLCCFILGKKPKKSRSVADYLFLNLSATSLFMSLFVTPFQAYTALAGRLNFLNTKTYSPACECIAFFYMFVSNASPFCHVAIAISRFFIVVLSRYLFLRTTGVNILMVFSPWILALFCTIWPLFRIGGVYGYNAQSNRCTTIASLTAYEYQLFLRSVAPLISVPSMIICYVAVFGKVIATKNRISVRRPDASILQTQGSVKGKIRRKQSEMQLTKVAFSTCLFFIVMYMPTTIYSLSAKDNAALRNATSLYLLIPSYVGEFMVS